MAACDINVGILEHTFIRRLWDYFEYPENNYNLHLLRDNYLFLFRGGLKINILLNTSELYSLPQGQSMCF